MRSEGNEGRTYVFALCLPDDRQGSHPKVMLEIRGGGVDRTYLAWLGEGD